MIKDFIEQLRIDGSLVTIKWIIIGCTLGLILGGALGATSVILFETKSGSSKAEFSKCIDFDSEGAKQFEDQYGGQDGVKAPDFCRKYGQGTDLVADRARSQMLWYGAFGLSIGLIIGLIIGNSKAEKRK